MSLSYNNPFYFVDIVPQPRKHRQPSYNEKEGAIPSFSCSFHQILPRSQSLSPRKNSRCAGICLLTILYFYRKLNDNNLIIIKTEKRRVCAALRRREPQPVERGTAVCTEDGLGVAHRSDRRSARLRRVRPSLRRGVSAPVKAPLVRERRTKVVSRLFQSSLTHLR